MTFPEAAYKILKEKKKPLHSKEILELVFISSLLIVMEKLKSIHGRI